MHVLCIYFVLVFGPGALNGRMLDLIPLKISLFVLICAQGYNPAGPYVNPFPNSEGQS